MINFGPVGFHLYGLFIGLGIWVAWELAIRVSRKRKLDIAIFNKAALWMIVGGIVGARLYHVMHYCNYYSVQFIKVLFVWEGGLGIWGAIIGGVLGLMCFKLLNKEANFLKIFDCAVVGMPLAQSLGRIGNFVNGEIVGKNGEPLFLYEMILNMILFGVLWKIRKDKRAGFHFGVYLFGYGVIRLLLEGMRETGDQWILLGAPVSYLASVASILIGIYFVSRKRN